MTALLARHAYPLSLAAATFMVAAGLPSGGDPDTYWHLASGRWMVEHRDLLRTDIFSSTIAGQPYSVGEWLGQIVLYLAYAGGGWAGLVILRAALVAIAALSLARVSLRAGAPVWAGLVVTLWAVVLSKVTWTDRPQLFTLALFPLLLEILFGARAGRTRLLLLVPPLLLVWTDLHGGYAVGLALLAIFTLAAMLERRQWRPFAIALAASLVATLVDPGALGLGGAASHAASPPRFIVEESPPDVLTPAGALFAGFALALLAAALLRGGSILGLLLTTPFLVLALSAQRHMPLFAIVATPFIAAALADGWRALGRGMVLPLPPRTAALLAAVLSIGALAAIPFAPSAPDERAYPAGALVALRASRGALLNEYDWGGWLIWRAPERPVFIDGRLFPYLPDVLDDYRAAVGLGPSWRDVLARRDVREVLLAPGRPLVTALREDGWPVVASGERWVLLRRP